MIQVIALRNHSEPVSESHAVAESRAGCQGLEKTERRFVIDPLLAYPYHCRQWPLRPNLWGRRFPITAFSAESAPEAWG